MSSLVRMPFSASSTSIAMKPVKPASKPKMSGSPVASGMGEAAVVSRLSPAGSVALPQAPSTVAEATTSSAASSTK